MKYQITDQIMRGERRVNLPETKKLMDDLIFHGRHNTWSIESSLNDSFSFLFSEETDGMLFIIATIAASKIKDLTDIGYVFANDFCYTSIDAYISSYILRNYVAYDEKKKQYLKYLADDGAEAALLNKLGYNIFFPTADRDARVLTFLDKYIIHFDIERFNEDLKQFDRFGKTPCLNKKASIKMMSEILDIPYGEVNGYLDYTQIEE